MRQPRSARRDGSSHDEADERAEAGQHQQPAADPARQVRQQEAVDLRTQPFPCGDERLEEGAICRRQVPGLLDREHCLADPALRGREIIDGPSNGAKVAVGGCHEVDECGLERPLKPLPWGSGRQPLGD